MTIEELEIIIKAKVEDALKSTKGLEQNIKNSMQKIQQNISKANFNVLTQKIQSAKKSFDKFKNDFQRGFSTKIDNSNSEKEIKKLQKEYNQVKQQIENDKIKLNGNYSKMDNLQDRLIQENLPTGLKLEQMPEGWADGIVKGNKEFQSLNSEADKLESLLSKNESKFIILGNNIENLKSKTQKISFGEKIGRSIATISAGFNNISNKIGNSLNSIREKMSNVFSGNGIKQGINHILRYALALLSIRSIYSLLSSSGKSWLSSQNAEAQQLNANIEYMRNALGLALAPVIQFITNLFYQLLKAVQTVVFALTGMNIFAKAGAKAFNSIGGSAKKTSKSAKEMSKTLAGVHSEINNVGGQNNAGGDSGGGPGGGMSPNIDLSKLSAMDEFSKKLYDFFKPLKDSWDNYGGLITSSFLYMIDGIKNAFVVMWDSVVTIITNGTIYQIISNILNSIGNIANAWATAWSNDGNGTALLQAIADIINGITEKINQLTASEGFQKFLNGIVSFFSGVAQFLRPVIDGIGQVVEKLLEIANSAVGDMLKVIGDNLQKIGQNEATRTLLEAIGSAIAIITTAIIAVKVALIAFNAVYTIFKILTAPTTLIIMAIVAAVTAIILIIKNWGSITDWIKNVWNNVVNGIKYALNALKESWKTVWNNIKNFVIGIWNGIKAGIVGVINGIIGGIEGFVNGVIKGINFLLKGISKVANGVGSLIGLKPINLAINEIHIPRLAKGNVATKETLAIFGEYSGAKSNPEITTPQNIMRETFQDVLKNTNGNNKPIHVTVQYLGKDIFDDTIEYINEKTQRTGRNTIIMAEA